MGGGPVATGGGIGGSKPVSAKAKWTGIMMTTFAAFGGLLFGYDTGTISGLQATKDWLRTFGHVDPTTKTGYAITTSQQSLVVSILSVGTFFGALMGAPMADLVGRKRGLLFTCIIFCIGVAMQTAATKMGLFIAGRIFAGLGVGLISVLVPTYQSECAPKWIRGAVVSCYQWAITIGLLLAAILSKVCENRDDHSAYRIPIGVQFIWAAVLAGGMSFLPESPRWLIKRGNEQKAAHALGRLLGTNASDPEVALELEDIKVNLAEEREMGAGTWLDCFKPNSNKILFRTLSGIFLQAWQQLTGINFIFYYGTTFFQNTGIANPFLISIATNVVNVGMTVPGIYLVDKVGRRRLLLIGATGMLICEYLVAIIGVTISVSNQSGQKALVALVCIYIAFFASTWGPIAWVVVGEIFPLNIRAKGIALSAASNWLFNWAIGYATPYLVNKGKGDAGLGPKVFFIWGTTCLGCLVFTYFCIPETKGLSLEQVDILYQNTTPIKSVAYRNQLIAHQVRAADADAIARVTSHIEENSRAGGVLGLRKSRTRDAEKGEKRVSEDTSENGPMKE